MSIIELDQFFDTPVTTYRRGLFSIKYAYARSADLEQTEERGQDYMAFHAEPDKVAFAICDGVSNSFLGGLAAQILGESLLAWLWDLKAPFSNLDRTELNDSLSQFLNSKVEQAGTIINRRDLKENDDEYVIRALEERRTRSGSQSNFVSGLILAPTKGFPKGLVLLFWLGDARLQIWHNKRNINENLQADWNSKEGWSSLRGVHGSIHSFISDTKSIDNIIAYSDGILPFEGQLTPDVADSLLNSTIEDLKYSHNDDISFLNVFISKQPYDLKDDLTAELRDEFPVIIKEEVMGKRSIPLLFYVAAGVIAILFYLFGLFLGFKLGSRPVKKELTPSQTPQIEDSILPFLTSTIESVPTEIPTALPTEILPMLSAETPQSLSAAEFGPIQESGVFLFEVNQKPFQLENECTNLVDLGLDPQSEIEMMITGQYILRGYPTSDCQGDQFVEIYADFPKDEWGRLNILSVKLVYQE